MENRKRILEFLDNKPDDNAMKKFDEEIEKNEALYGDFSAVKGALERLDSLASVESDTGYFESVLPRFRERLVAEKSRRAFPILVKVGGALAVPAVAALLFLLSPSIIDGPGQGSGVVDKSSGVVTGGSFGQNAKTNGATDGAEDESTVGSPESNDYRVDGTTNGGGGGINRFQQRKVYAVHKAAPLITDSEMDDLILESDKLVNDESLLAEHKKFDGVYKELLGLDKSSLAEAVDIYDFPLSDIVENLSDDDWQVLSAKLSPNLK